MYNGAAVTFCAIIFQQNSNLLECHHVYYFIIQISAVLSSGITYVNNYVHVAAAWLCKHHGLMASASAAYANCLLIQTSVAVSTRILARK